MMQDKTLASAPPLRHSVVTSSKGGGRIAIVDSGRGSISFLATHQFTFTGPGMA